MIIEAIGRRLRLAIIGGGPGSVIGEVHRAGARLDGYYDIVASALSSDPERSRRSGRAIGVPEERAYPSWRDLIESEANRKDRRSAFSDRRRWREGLSLCPSRDAKFCFAYMESRRSAVDPVINTENPGYRHHIVISPKKPMHG
jgi:hypothetical protein